MTVQRDLRDAPTHAFIEDIRARFDVEPEWDEVLTRKLRLRSEPRHEVWPLEHLESCLRHFLAEQVDGEWSVSDVRWLSGGASKLQVAFHLAWQDATGRQRSEDLVMRLEPKESLNSTSRRREAQLLGAVADVLPVPEVRWVDADATWFPAPCLIYEFAKGVSKPRNRQSQVSGVGGNLGQGLRPALADQFIAHLAQMHSMDVDAESMDTFRCPRVGSSDAAWWELERARRIWAEDREHELPLLDVASEWLEERLPTLDRVSIIHGDFRVGNFLFDEDSGRITSWLDWERGALGDRHRDLAWTTLPQAGHLADDGATFLVSGLVPLDEFLSRYEEASGLPVDPVRLNYYRVLNCFQIVVSMLGTAHRVARTGGSHQDILLSWLEGSGHMTADNLRRALLEAQSHA